MNERSKNGRSKDERKADENKLKKRDKLNRWTVIGIRKEGEEKARVAISTMILVILYQVLYLYDGV